MSDPTVGNEDAIRTVLEQLGSKVGDTKRGYVHASCPLAPFRHEKGVDNNPSFGVVYNSAEAHKMEGHSHCFSCGYSGDLREIAATLYAYQKITAADLEICMAAIEHVKTGNLPLSLSAHKADDPWDSTLRTTSLIRSNSRRYSETVALMEAVAGATKRAVVGRLKVISRGSLVSL